MQKRADAAVDRASRQLGIEKGDVERQDRLKQDLLGGLSLESADEIINKTATIPGVKLPGDFDISGRLTEIKDRTLNPEEFLANLRSQFGEQQPAPTPRTPEEQAQQRSVIEQKILDAQNDPGRAPMVEFNQKRLEELLAKGRNNLTVDERNEAQSILRFFGVR